MKNLITAIFFLSAPLSLFSNTYEKYTSRSSKKPLYDNNKNTFTIGYQIGGLTLAGFDYEFRTSDVLGIHIGVGVKGYTAGVKLHVNPQEKFGNYVNISFKDGGFGLINTLGAEYGFFVPLNKQTRNSGLIIQVGLAAITKINQKISDRLYGEGAKVPPAILSFGIGVAF